MKTHSHIDVKSIDFTLYKERGLHGLFKIWDELDESKQDSFCAFDMDIKDPTTQKAIPTNKSVDLEDAQKLDKVQTKYNLFSQGEAVHVLCNAVRGTSKIEEASAVCICLSRDSAFCFKDKKIRKVNAAYCRACLEAGNFARKEEESQKWEAPRGLNAPIMEENKTNMPFSAEPTTEFLEAHIVPFENTQQKPFKSHLSDPYCPAERRLVFNLIQLCQICTDRNACKYSQFLKPSQREASGDKIRQKSIVTIEAMREAVELNKQKHDDDIAFLKEKDAILEKQKRRTALDRGITHQHQIDMGNTPLMPYGSNEADTDGFALGDR